MNRLNIMSDTEAKLFEIVKRFCNRREDGEVYDYEVANEYNRLYPKAFHKQETISRLLRFIRNAGYIVGGRCVEEVKGQKVQRTKYHLVEKARSAA